MNEKKESPGVRLGRYMRRSRVASGKTVREMAALTELEGLPAISPQYWSYLETENERAPERPSETLLRQIAHALDRSIEEVWLVAFEDSVPDGLRVVPSR